MKLTAWLATLVMLLVLAVCLAVSLTSPWPGAPGFCRAQPARWATQISYDFLNPRPFESGKMWVAADREVLVYDLESHRVFGQVSVNLPGQFSLPPFLWSQY
jgi:hypothetical protein